MKHTGAGATAHDASTVVADTGTAEGQRISKEFNVPYFEVCSAPILKIATCYHIIFCAFLTDSSIPSLQQPISIRVQTSARTGEGVSEMFLALATKCVQQQIAEANRSLSAQEMDDLVRLESEKTKRLSNCIVQ